MLLLCRRFHLLRHSGVGFDIGIQRNNKRLRRRLCVGHLVRHQIREFLGLEVRSLLHRSDLFFRFGFCLQSVDLFLSAVLCQAQGTSVITEGVWDSRYRYVDELRRMGAHIQVDGKVAVIEGVETLTGAPIHACDLRAGAAMVIVGLAARGITEVDGVSYIERGYEDLVGKLSGVGADISTVVVPDEKPQPQVG